MMIIIILSLGLVRLAVIIDYQELIRKKHRKKRF